MKTFILFAFAVSILVGCGNPTPSLVIVDNGPPCTLPVGTCVSVLSIGEGDGAVVCTEEGESRKQEVVNVYESGLRCVLKTDSELAKFHSILDRFRADGERIDSKSAVLGEVSALCPDANFPNPSVER